MLQYSGLWRKADSIESTHTYMHTEKDLNTNGKHKNKSGINDDVKRNYRHTHSPKIKCIVYI